MQTIATMAKRLDMSADEALNTLRKLRFGVDDFETEISDEQCDMLMDVDEDPSALDKMLAEILKKEEDVKKKLEREKAAAEKKKIAAEKKAATAERKKVAAVKKAAAAEKKKEAAAKKAAAAEKKKEAAKKKAAAKKTADKTPTEEPPTETLPEPVVVEIQVEEPPTPTISSAPEEEAAVTEPSNNEPAAPPIVEIINEEEEDAEEKYPHHASEAHTDDGPGGALAKAERRQAEEEQRRKERPLSVPDPDVVASVIRKAEERNRRTTAAKAEAKKPARPATRPERPQRNSQGGTLPREALAKVMPLEPESGKGEGGRRGQNMRGAAKKPGVTGKTARKRQKRTEKAKALDEIMRRDAGAAVRGVLSGATVGGALPKKRKKKRDKEMLVEEVEEMVGEIEVDEALSVEKFAESMGADVSDVILSLMDENVMANKNQMIDVDLMRKIADKFNYTVNLVIPEEEDIFMDEPDNPEDLELRAPVVTVMGHVDHGKTSLLDVVREANVADGEAGGITQHIAAYDVEMEQGRVVFLDTPGHEAFTQMRSRGAHVTDVVVLVVAADDGVKPQTIEAIDHARAAEVPIVVAVNKCDKANAQPDRVRQELVQHELVSEEWGGKTIIKNISAHTKEGIDELMELLVLESQLLELKANPKKSGRGTIVESEVTKGLGPVAWVLVQEGTLRVGDSFLAGSAYGRVRTMTNSRGKQVKEVGPSTPVAVTGFNAPPDAGCPFAVVADERIARNIAEKRALIQKLKRGPAARKMTLEDFHASMEAGEQKTLNVIIKADVQGSTDVLHSSLTKVGNDEVTINVVNSGVGGVNESDVILAGASNAVIIGFHVTANPKVQQLAMDEGVEIRSYRIIYEAIDDVRKALEGMLTPDSKEVVLGHAETRAVFRSSALGNIAGCSQIDGQSDRNALARLIRDGVIVYEGKIATLRREKDDVKSVATGFECGIRLDKFDDIQAGDIIETYKIELIAKKLG